VSLLYAAAHDLHHILVSALVDVAEGDAVPF